MEDHIQLKPDRVQLLGRQTYKWPLWDVVFHGNTSTLKEMDFLVCKILRLYLSSACLNVHKYKI